MNLKYITIVIEKGMQIITPLVSDKKTDINENKTVIERSKITFKFFFPNNMNSVMEPKTKDTWAPEIQLYLYDLATSNKAKFATIITDVNSDEKIINFSTKENDLISRNAKYRGISNMKREAWSMSLIAKSWSLKI